MKLKPREVQGIVGKYYGIENYKVHRFPQKKKPRWGELSHEYKQYSFTIFL